MIWLFAILIVLALGAIAVVAGGRGGPMAPAYDDSPDSLVPAEGPVTAEDLRRIRFPLAFRGYRMAEVDALLERLSEEREAEGRERSSAAQERTDETPAETPAETPVETPAGTSATTPAPEPATPREDEAQHAE